MNTTEAKKKYSFQTVVVPAEVRSEFTTVREEMGTSDKQLALAMWNIVMRDRAALEKEVAELKAVAAHLKEISKISKSEAPTAMAKAAKGKKVAKKEVKPKKEKPAKKNAKAPKVDVSSFEVVYDASMDDDNSING